MRSNAKESSASTGGPSLGARFGQALLRLGIEVMSTVVPAVLIALFINVFVAEAMVIDGPSMRPNLDYDHQVIVEKVTFRFIRGPRRGDVVVVDVPDAEAPLIKRVVALGGETIEVRGGRIFINEEPLDEPWATRLGGPSFAPTFVPPLHIFVVGDNRGVSLDSRYYGPFHVDQVIGRALVVYWPLDEIGPIE